MPFRKCPFRSPFKNALYHDVLFQNVLCNALSQFALYQTAIKQERSIFIIHVISDCEISNAWGVDFRSCFFSWQSIFFSASFLVRIALTGKGWNSVEQGWNKLGHIRGDASEQFHWSGWAILGRQRARPLSVSFLFRTSGKETEAVSPLGMEKYGRFDFSPWKPEYLTHNRPESMMAYADVQFSLFRFQFHALLRSGEPLFPRWSLKLLTEVFWSFVRPPAGWLRF